LGIAGLLIAAGGNQPLKPIPRCFGLGADTMSAAAAWRYDATGALMMEVAE